ncbi:rho guanine nucleotide exchange factor 17 [Trichonephila clavipes]|nr:rho guanine nucleotide exchange factor 17 [Trichonephila clavipes]
MPTPISSTSVDRVQNYEVRHRQPSCCFWVRQPSGQALKSTDYIGVVEGGIVDEIFFQIPEILHIHEEFFESLTQRCTNWDVKFTVGDLFVEAFTKQHVIDTYTAFINNWKCAKDATKIATQAKPAFARFLEHMSREHKGKLALDALLIMPVQRIPRYELLLKEYSVRFSQFKELSESLKFIMYPDVTSFDKLNLPQFHCDCFVSMSTMSQRSHLTDLEAWRVVGRLEASQTQAEAAQAIGVSQSVIYRIWNRFLEAGSAGQRPGQDR